VVIVGSPGFVKDDFMKHMVDKATRAGDSAFLKQVCACLAGNGTRAVCAKKRQTMSPVGGLHCGPHL
jgi:hypothetical protein